MRRRRRFVGPVKNAHSVYRRQSWQVFGHGRASHSPFDFALLWLRKSSLVTLEFIEEFVGRLLKRRLIPRCRQIRLFLGRRVPLLANPFSAEQIDHFLVIYAYLLTQSNSLFLGPCAMRCMPPFCAWSNEVMLCRVLDKIMLTAAAILHIILRYFVFR